MKGRNELKANDLKTAVLQSMAELKVIQQRLARFGLVTLTAEQRQHSTGRLRANESAAIAAILDTVDAKPGLFAALAPIDHGSDDQVVETGPARAALERRDALAPMLPELQKLTDLVSDDVLHAGELAREVSSPAYAIIKVNAGMDASVQASASTALDFYGAPSRKRAANQRKAQRSPKSNQ